MKLCKECGSAFDEKGGHHKTFSPLSNKMLEIVGRIKCAGCNANVSIETMRGQGLEKWHIMHLTGKLFCPGCSHQLKLDR